MSKFRIGKQLKNLNISCAFCGKERRLKSLWYKRKINTCNSKECVSKLKKDVAKIAHESIYFSSDSFINKWKGENNPNWSGGAKTKRAIRLANSIGHHTRAEWRKVKEKYKFTCLCCKKQEPEIKLSEDHIVPLIKGGSNNIDNIQPLCLTCNKIKARKIINFIKNNI